MTASPRIAAALGPLLAAPAAFAHDNAASGGSVEMLLLFLGAAVVALSGYGHGQTRRRAIKQELRTRRWILLALALPLTGCSHPPSILTENPPHYVVVGQTIGMSESATSVRVKVDNAANAQCQKYGRTAKLPAHSTECIGRHLFLGYCLTYAYTYECVVPNED